MSKNNTSLPAQNEAFDSAVDLAIASGSLRHKSLASKERSKIEGNSFVLRTLKGEFITRISLVALGLGHGAPASSRNEIAFHGTKEERACMWARSMGYPVPTKMNGCLAGVLVMIGLFAAIVPGLIILFWIFHRQNQYQIELKALVVKWVDAGQPLPGEAVKRVDELEELDKDKDVVAYLSTQERLEELMDLKNKGFIDEEEYKVMRKNALGM